MASFSIVTECLIIDLGPFNSITSTFDKGMCRRK